MVVLYAILRGLLVSSSYPSWLPLYLAMHFLCTNKQFTYTLPTSSSSSSSSQTINLWISIFQNAHNHFHLVSNFFLSKIKKLKIKKKSWNTHNLFPFFSQPQNTTKLNKYIVFNLIKRNAWNLLCWYKYST
jgi:hypothetical protein